jgi:hypothetical protein
MSGDLRSWARALGGEPNGRRDSLNCPGPGHSKLDRSLTVTLSPSAPDGFLVCSHAGDDPLICKDYVRQRVGLPAWEPERPDRPKARTSRPLPATRSDHDNREHERALWLWRQRQPVAGTIAETYLRSARGYGGPIPATLGFLPARGDHEPALIAAFGLAVEPKPGVLAIDDDAVKGVHLVKLRPDGSGKAAVEPNKITVGRGAVGSPIVLAAMNDLLGLAVTDGIEDALSIHEATGLGAWAAGGASRMPALAAAVPDACDCVTIIGDDDPKGAGRRFALALAEGLRARGFRDDQVIVKILRAEVEA